MTRPRLDSLTSLRFFAALLVVLHHTTRDLGSIPIVSSILTMGTAGVGFFFALSGFLLTWSAREGDTRRAFYRRRFARVYPMHFVMLIVAVPVLLLIGQDIGFGEIVANVLLVQGWVDDSNVYFGMNSPSWSLAAELLFYVLFPFVIPLLARLNYRQTWAFTVALVVIGLVTAIVITMAIDGGGDRFWLYIFPPYRLIGFIAGCCAARLMILGFRWNCSPLVATIYAGFMYGALLAVQSLIGSIGHGIEDAVLLPFILALLVAAASSDVRGGHRVLANRRLVALGTWSFALYITHWLFLQVAVFAMPDIAAAPVPVRVLADVVFACAAIAISWLAFATIEKPLERRLRGGRIQAPVDSPTIARSGEPVRG